MTNAFKSIQQGLTEAIAHAKTNDTETTGVKLYLPQLLTVTDAREDDHLGTLSPSTKDFEQGKKT
jgi:hypothetical protein